MSYEHANKRQRIDDGSRDGEDRLNPPPSPCVHVRNLCEHAHERDLEEAVRHFGAVRDVMIWSRKRQGLIEFEDINGAKSCVEYFKKGHSIYCAGLPALFNYSLSQKIQKTNETEDTRPVNHILLFTILNPQYPINVEVMKTICSPYGQVQRIVIFKKNGCQAMVEFDNIDSSKRARSALNGADIYSGCCTLKIEYAKPTKLNVKYNDGESWDYTNPHLGGERGPLLQEPRFGTGPSPYNGPAGRGGSFSGAPSSGGFGGPGGHGNYYDEYDGYGQQGPYGAGPDHFGPKRGPDHFGRGGYDQGGPPSGSVCMVYGLNMDKMNCDKIFNLFCLFGNVTRVKFLKSKENSAMVQLGDPLSVDRAIANLNNIYFFDSKMQLGMSKQAFLQEVPNPHELPDGSSSYKDFQGNRNNRFSTPAAAQKNRIQSPSKVLHFFNAPPNITTEQLNNIFEEAIGKIPVRIKQNPSKTERSCTGLMEFETKADAIEALVMANHTPLSVPGGKSPFIFKLCFSSMSNRERE